MTERFNVAGAMLAKLYGRPAEEQDLFSGRAGRVRDIGVLTAIWGSALITGLGLLATLSTSVVYGLGGWLTIRGEIKVGELVALALLLSRLYGPITSLSNVQVNVMTALVSFDRVFEVLDLEPLITERPGRGAAARVRADAIRVRAGIAPDIEFDARAVPLPGGVRGLAGLAGVDRAASAGAGRTLSQYVLHDVSFARPAGKLTALVGPVRRGQDHHHPPGLRGCTTRSTAPCSSAARTSGT